MNGSPQNGSLRAAALIAMLIGAVGSLGLMFHAGERTPRFLLVLFFFWVLGPFAAFLLADRVSKRWPASVRSALYTMMLVVTLGSLAVYGDDARGHRRPQAAFVYVAVPPASVLLSTIVVSMAALMSRKRSRPGDG